MKHKHCSLIVVLCFALFSGCGASERSPQFASNSAPPVADIMMKTPGLATTARTAMVDPTANQSEATVPDVSPKRVVRKIIYDSNISLIVESFDDVSAMVVELTEQCDGFIASVSLYGDSGDQLSGTWTIRLPVEQYRRFLDSAGSLGEINSKTEQTREVTAEFYDIEARIRNKQTEEKRLFSLLEERTGKLDEILAVEKEISRVRGEIEQMQGQLRVFADLTAFSTVTLQISEVRNYVPLESPSFQVQIAREWQSTVDNLTSAGQSLVLTTIHVGPWLLILLLLAVPVYLLRRWRFRLQTNRPAA